MSVSTSVVAGTEERPHLLHVFPMFAPGGAELRTVRLITALAARFRHSVLATNGDLRAAAWFPPGVPVEFLPPVPKAKAYVMVPRLRKVIAAAKPDLVLTYGFGAFDGAMAARTLGLPVIHHEDGFNADEAAGFNQKRVIARRFFFRTLHRVVVPSTTLESIATSVWKLPRERVQFIPNGIAGFPPEATVTRESLGFPEGVPVVAFVGNLRTEKNVARLLAACEKNVKDGVDLRVLVFGEGPERRALEKQAESPALAGKVRFLGHQTSPWSYRAAIDVFALASDTEQMPISILEAMACEIPVVATDVGDIKSMLPEESKRLVVPLSGPATLDLYAAMLGRLLRDGALRAHLGRLNAAHVRTNYAFSRTVETYETLYREALR